VTQGNSCQRVGFFLKLPTGGRATFAVIRYVIEGGKKKHSTVKDERILAINKAFKSGTLSQERAREQLDAVIDSLYKREGSVTQALKRSGLLSDNQKVFERFWEEVYEGREILDRQSMKADYERALRVLGTVSLLSGTKAEIAKAIRANSKNVAQHRRVVDRLNTVLKFLKRDLHLDKPQESVGIIKHLTKSDIEKLISFEEDPTYRDLYVTLFASGCRLGEAIGLEPESMLADIALFIGSQVLPSGERRLPKRGKTGKSIFLPQYKEAIERWLVVEDKQRYRHNLRRRLKKLTKKAWPKDPKKHISVHGFRHSHAIHYLSLGVPMEWVARNLRNRIEVCQKFYAGYAHSEASAEALHRILLSAVSSKA
jgi:integrase